jgi:hypothetical protein
MAYPSVDCIINLRKKSCSIEDAVAKLLGWLKGPVSHGSIRVDNGPITIEQLEYLDTLVFSLEDHLISLRQDAIYKLDDAVIADAPDDVKRPLLDAAIDVEFLIEKAKGYFLDIQEELDKGELSELVEDHSEKDASGKAYITIKSLDRWSRKRYGIKIPDAVVTSAPEQIDTKSLSVENENRSVSPWLIPEPNDPPAIQPWYTPARYFARQLIKEQPTLLGNRKLLADKVRNQLIGARIYKRGGKKPLDSSTIKKAFINVVF